MLDPLKTKDIGFWLAQEEDCARAIIKNKNIIGVEILEPKNLKEEIERAIIENINNWSTSSCDQLATSCHFSRDVKDKYSFMKTISVSQDTKEPIKEKAVGQTWPSEYVTLMDNLRLHKVSMPANECDYLQNDMDTVEEQSIDGWIMRDWKAIYTEDQDTNNNKHFVVDTAIWEKIINLEGKDILVVVRTKSPWFEY